MDWITGIQNAVNYIEDHLTEKLDFSEVAKQAAVSPFYFQRIFNALCGISLGEYIRSRRLSLAGRELAAGTVRVIDVALKYGYDSPESFARAFSRFHNVCPSEAKNSCDLKYFSRVSVQILLKGGSIMNYKIVKKEAFKVLERRETQEIDDAKNQNTIPDFWTRSQTDGTVATLLSKSSDTSFIYGICYNNQHTDNQTFDYSIAALYDGDEIPDGFSVTEIPKHTWLVFPVVGAMPDAIQEAWHKICSEFIPTSNYTPTFEMDIEAYTAGEMNSPDYKSEIWVPVVEK